MMAFETVQAALETDVFNATDVAGNFRIISTQAQSQSSDEVEGNLKSLEVYFSSGEFGQVRNGNTQHDAVYKLDMTVSAPASVDLSVINDSGSTAAQKKVAIDAMFFANKQADIFLNKFIRDVYQLVMDARNNQLKLDENGSGIVIANRSINNLVKNAPLPRGEMVLLTGSMDLMVRMTELVPGLTGPDGEDIDTVSQTASIDSETIDAETKTGVTVPV